MDIWKCSHKPHKTYYTSAVRKLPPIDLVLHHIGPVEQAMTEVEVEGDGVPQAWHEQAVVTLMEVDATDLMADGEDDEGLKWVWC